MKKLVLLKTCTLYHAKNKESILDLSLDLYCNIINNEDGKIYCLPLDRNFTLESALVTLNLICNNFVLYIWLLMI